MDYLRKEPLFRAISASNAIDQSPAETIPGAVMRNNCWDREALPLRR
ncbi:MAG: hypothetical protein ACJ0Q1_06440 [Luminiphilus sp.]